MVELSSRGMEEMQEDGAWHWKRHTTGDWLQMGFLWVSSLYCIGLFATPGMEEAIILFLIPFLGGGAALIGSLLWLVLLLGAVAFALGIPGLILHHSFKYSAEGSG